MPRRCTVCNHRESAEITKAIAAGVSVRDAAHRFGVTPAAVSRHKINCLRQRSTERATREPVQSTGEPVSSRIAADADPRSLVLRAEALLADAETIVRDAKADGNAKLAIAAIRETRSSLELLLKVHGLLQPDGVTIDQRSVTINAPELPEEEMRAIVAAARKIAGSSGPISTNTYLSQRKTGISATEVIVSENGRGVEA